MAEPLPEPASVPPADVLDTGRAGGLVMRGSLLRLAGFGAGGLLTAVSAIVLTRHLGVSRFGQYATIVALATLVTQLTEGGLTSLATRDYALSAPSGKAKLLSDRLGLQVVTTIVAIGLCGVFALGAGYGQVRTWGALGAALGLGLASIQLTLAVPLVAGLRLGLTSGLELARQAVLVGLTVALALAGAGLLPLLFALVPSSALVLAATWAIVRTEVPLRPVFDPRAWVALARPALVLSLSTGLATIYVFTTQILTSLAASATQTGYFAASLRIFAVVASVPGLMVMTALPLLARAARDDAERLEFALDRLFAAALIAGVGVGLVLVTGARPIIDVIAGHRFAGAVAPLRIEGAAVLGTCLSPVWNTGLLALHRHGAMLVCNVLSLAVTVALTLALAPAIGARGSAVATVAGEWIVSLALLVALARANRRLVPRGARLLPRVLIAAGAGLCALLVPVAPVAQLFLSVALFALLIVLLRAFPRELLELVPSRFRRTGESSAEPAGRS